MALGFLERRLSRRILAAGAAASLCMAYVERSRGVSERAFVRERASAILAEAKADGRRSQVLALRDYLRANVTRAGVDVLRPSYLNPQTG